MKTAVASGDDFEYRDAFKYIDLGRGHTDTPYWLPYDPTMLKIEQRIDAIKSGLSHMLDVTSPLTPPVLPGGGTTKEFLQLCAKHLRNHLDAIDSLIEEL